MTTITVVRKNGEIAIAADTLTKYSYTKESSVYVANHEKIFRVGDSYLALSGSATLDLAIRDYFEHLAQPPKLDTVPHIFRVWNDLHRSLSDKYFLNPRKDEDDSVESMRARVLVANPRGIFGIDSHRYVQEFTRFYAYGAGCDFALGAMYALYPSDLAAIEIAKFGVAAAAEFDDSTGLPSTSYVIRERPRSRERPPAPEGPRPAEARRRR
jgi:ATP-dependent HslUV protease, peptidase subunit HslV